MALLNNVFKNMKKGEPREISFKVVDTVGTNDSFLSSTESSHLITSNKQTVKRIISMDGLAEDDIIDALISLHLVLEISLNTLYRHISLKSIKKGVSIIDVIENIDGISYIDKTILFIYNSKFNFTDIELATRYHKIIGKLRNFAYIRNNLLHGHSVSTFTDEDGHHKTKIKGSLNKEVLHEQINKFLFITEGMRYYIDCLDSSLDATVKKNLKLSYLDDGFILDNHPVERPPSAPNVATPRRE